MRSNSIVDTGGLLAIEGFSVLQMVRAFEAASGRRVPLRIAPRCPGVIAERCAETANAEPELDWRTRRSLDNLKLDAWRWQA